VKNYLLDGFAWWVEHFWPTRYRAHPQLSPKQMLIFSYFPKKEKKIWIDD
jgi:hypothetical protein